MLRHWWCVLLVLGATRLPAQQPRRYMVRVHDAVDTGVVEQRARRLGHEAKNLTRNIVLVTERPRARGGRPGLLDSLLQLRRDRRAGIHETMEIEEDTYVILDDPVSGPSEAASAWNLRLIGANNAWAAGDSGQGQVIGIMDSGFGPNPDVTVWGGKNFGVGADTLDLADNVSLCRGHGTHVAGTAAGKQWGVAPGARVAVLKVFQVLGGQCLAYSSVQMTALIWAREHGVWIMNASIGGGASIFFMDEAIRYEAAGGVFCAAAGNAGVTPPDYPANYPSTIAVGGVASNLVRASWSNYGGGLEVMAPGASITSDAPGGGTAVKNGTSMASPHCAGAVALIRGAGGGVQARALLSATADSIGESLHYANGLIRPDKAIATLQGGVLLAGPAVRDYTAPQLDSIRVVSTVSWSVSSSRSSAFRRGDFAVFSAGAPDTVVVRHP